MYYTLLRCSACCVTFVQLLNKVLGCLSCSLLRSSRSHDCLLWFFGLWVINLKCHLKSPLQNPEYTAVTVQVQIGLLAILCFVRDVLRQVGCQSQVELWSLEFPWWFWQVFVCLSGLGQSVFQKVSVFVDQCQTNRFTFKAHWWRPLFLQVTMLLCCATILAIIQYCNFCQLSFWMRSVLATATGVILLLVLYSPLHRYRSAHPYYSHKCTNLECLYVHALIQQKKWWSVHICC